MSTLTDVTNPSQNFVTNNGVSEEKSIKEELEMKLKELREKPDSQLSEDEKNKDIIVREKEYLYQYVINTGTLYEEIKKKSLLLQNQYHQIQKELQKKEFYIVDLQNRLEAQINNLLSEKEQIETEYAKVLQKNQYQQRELDMKLQESMLQLNVKDNLLSKLTKELEQLKEENIEVNRMKQNEFQNLSETVKKLEKQIEGHDKLVQQLKEIIDKKETQLMELRANLTNENEELKNLLERKMEQLSRQNMELTSQQMEQKAIYEELETYKARAQKVFQAKEKQIEDLTNEISKLSSSSENRENSDEQLGRQQILLSNNKNIQMIEQLEKDNEVLRSNMEIMKRNYENDINTFKIKMKSLEQNLEKQKELVSSLQHNILILKQGGEDAKLKMQMADKLFADTLKSRDNIISSLKIQMAEMQKEKETLQHQQQHAAVISEMEEKVRMLGNHLLEKQSYIDTLKSEKAAILFQWEKEAQRAKELELVNRLNPIGHFGNSISNHHDGRIIDIEADGYSTVSIKTSTIFSDLSHRGFIVQRFAGLMNSIDRLSLYSGMYLRRLPLLRIFLVVYIILLHIWVIFILYHAILNLEIVPTSAKKIISNPNIEILDNPSHN